MRAVLSLLVASLATIANAQSPLSPEEGRTLQDGLITTADAFILPAYEAQAAAAEALTVSLTAYCTEAGELENTHRAFADTFLAWQRASIIQVGPIMEAEGPMRVQLWPDPKGFSQRAIRTALRAEAPELLEKGGLEGRSIALTGLTALEYLLYSDLKPESYACDLARAIGIFQSDLAEDLVVAWSPGSNYRDAFDSAVKGNALYANVDALMREFLSGTVVYVDRLRKFKILRGLGNRTGEARAERTEARLSGLGLQSIETSFQVLSELYGVPFGLFDIAPDIGGSMEYFVLAETAASVAGSLGIMEGSLVDIATEDGARAQDIRRVADLVLYHETFLKSGFTDALGLSAGFTSADGD